MSDLKTFYSERYQGSLFVIKAGGKIIEDDAARTGLLEDISELISAGIKVLLIYGGGRAMDEALSLAGITSRREEGIRLTAAPDMKIIQGVMAGDLAYRISSDMEKLSVSGLVLASLPSGWLELEFPERAPEYMNFDASVKHINGMEIMGLFSGARFIACPCLTSAYGHGVNINADNVAVSIASGVQARKLIFLSDVNGVLDEGKTVSVLTDSDIYRFIENGTVTDGMKVKMENCLAALDGGVRRIHLINGLTSHALSQEIYNASGTGFSTMIMRESDRGRYAGELQIEMEEVV